VKFRMKPNAHPPPLRIGYSATAAHGRFVSFRTLHSTKRPRAAAGKLLCGYIPNRPQEQRQ